MGILCFNTLYVWFSSEPGYVATPIAMVQAALALLEDTAYLPKQWVFSYAEHIDFHYSYCMHVSLWKYRFSITLSIALLPHSNGSAIKHDPGYAREIVYHGKVTYSSSAFQLERM